MNLGSSRNHVFARADHHGFAPSKGFTLVELLIVIVVIAILAAITIVAYNGVQQRAKTAVLQNDLTEAAQRLEVYKVDNGNYPATQPIATAAGLKSSSGNAMTYQALGGGSGYVLTDTYTSSNTSYYVSSAQTVPTPGIAPDTTNGLVAWIPFDGSPNELLNNTIGTLTPGVVSAAGQSGAAKGAYQFVGSTDAITMSDSSVTSPLKPPLPLTISLWFDASSLANNPTLFSSDWFSCNVPNPYYYGVDIFFSNGTTPNASVGNGGGCGSRSRFSNQNPSTTIATGQWYNLVVTIEATPNIKIYVNGVDAGGATGGGGTVLAYSSAPTTIGNSSDGTGRFQGSIDDVRIYNRALSASEITTLYAAGAQ